ncbi:dipeptidase [Kordiimonas pumila]|uniref:Dipeptidase n=1 Tax=Kordiimonas pumila TaxID=2161677 RepID=A0ABV7D9C8_9PROT|nr:dipeptidase [Kordiimonas pumila]
MKKLIVSLSILAAACSETPDAPQHDYQADADKIAHSIIIADTHIDVPYRMKDKWEDTSRSTETGNFDYPRAVAGGLDAPFMSIYTPAEYDGTPKAKQNADAMIDIVERMVAEAPDKFIIVRTVAETKAAVAEGKIALPLGMENGSPISGDLANLDYFFERGIRYITLAHAKSNEISDSSYDPHHQWNGLSDFGKTVVQHMNELGIMVDVSHISDDAFYDVIEVSATPVLATHSSARKFTPGFERNMSDEMIKKLAEHDGIIMINYGSSFLTEEANKYGSIQSDAYKAYLAESGAEENEETLEAFEEEYKLSHPYPYADIEDVLDHIDHVVSLTSVDHVGIGSDYDGVGDSLPTGLKDVSSYTNLIAGLLKRGYSKADIEKIMSGNLFRVWQAVEAYAEGH